MSARTVGVEEELMLLDARTGAPVAVADSVLDAGSGGDSGTEPGGLEAELQQEQVETETEPLTDLGVLAAQLRERRRTAAQRAAAHGAVVAALASSPLSAEPTLTAKRRYAWMLAEFGLSASEQLVCGCHVHVGVASPEEAVAVLDRIRVWLPVLLAISANSPYWQGVDSGHASYRAQVWARLPTAGPVGVHGSAEAYEEHVGRLLATGVVRDRGMVYFDARLSHRYPTVEIRTADVCLRAEDGVLVAALVRGLVETAAREWQEGRPAPELPTDVLRLAGWRAGRSGLHGELLDPFTGVPRPAPAILHRLVEHLAPALVAARDDSLVSDGLDGLLRRGTGADQQRALHRRHHDLGAVALSAAELSVD